MYPDETIDRLAGRADIDQDGAYGREPAHRARKVDFTVELFAAVSFDIHKLKIAACPCAQRLGKRRNQCIMNGNVPDARQVGSQYARFFRDQRYRHTDGGAFEVAAACEIARQRSYPGGADGAKCGEMHPDLRRMGQC